MRVYRISNSPERAEYLFKRINVDRHAFGLMLPKARPYLILIKDIPSYAATILKQEMLSLGADAAVPRQCLVSPQKKAEVLLIGNLKHYNLLVVKLKKQPFNMKKLSVIISEIVKEKTSSLWKAGRFNISLKKPVVMGIINLTYDSFSGDGILRISRTEREVVNNVLKRTEDMVRRGTRIIDIGAQSSRPFSKPIPRKEEEERIIPVLKSLVREFRDIPVSVDTYRPEVARAVLQEGASIINDVKGTRDSKMLKVLKDSDCGVVIMHMQGSPRTMQKRPSYDDVVLDIIDFLKDRLEKAHKYGIDVSRIVVDPGIGFGKTVKHNYRIIKYIDEFSVLGRPLLLGLSRKSLLGAVLNKRPRDRIYGTLAASSWVLSKGVRILRTHDPEETHDVIKIMESIRNA